MRATDAEVSRIADEIEVSAFRDLYAAAPRDLVANVGLETREVGGATLLIAPRIPEAMFNRAIALGMRQPAREGDVDAIVAAFRTAGSPNFWIHWTPTARPSDVPSWLSARGFALPPRRSWAKMIRGPENPPHFATDLDIRPVRENELPAVVAAICTAFGMPDAFAPWIVALAHRPGWRAYGAFEGAKAVGGGYTFTEHEVAWLGLGGVLREYRGRSAHRELMALRIREAAAAGCVHIVTETGEPIDEEPNPSLANMARCGFAKVCSRLNYAAPDP